MADDLGFSDLGCYGGEIRTPNLDSLAENGLRFTQFYNTGRCWPTRGSLLSGYYAQQIRRDFLPGVPTGGGNRGKRPSWAVLLPEMLAEVGYRSYHTGKWHIDDTPTNTGFQKTSLNQVGRYFSPKPGSDGKRGNPLVFREDYYLTSAMADDAIENLRDHAKDHRDDPFFQYLAFTAPHFPLHALPEDIAIYAGHLRRGLGRDPKATLAANARDGTAGPGRQPTRLGGRTPARAALSVSRRVRDSGRWRNQSSPALGQIDGESKGVSSQKDVDPRRDGPPHGHRHRTCPRPNPRDGPLG